MSGSAERTGQAVGTNGATPGLCWLAAATAVLVLAQAILAGRWIGGDLGLITTHGWIGNVTFLAAIVLAVQAFLARRRGAVGAVALGLSLLLLVLVTAQLGLGYGGRTSNAAAAWHVPNGVLIFGLTAAILTLSLPRRSRSTR